MMPLCYAQSRLVLCGPKDCSPAGSSVHGIFQTRILERVAISFSRGSSQPRDQTPVSCVSCIGRGILYYCATWEARQLLRVEIFGLFMNFFHLQHSNSPVTYLINYTSSMYLEGASLIAQLVKNPPAMQETPVQFLGQEDLLKKG